jgi:hypothetical protein
MKKSFLGGLLVCLAACSSDAPEILKDDDPSTRLFSDTQCATSSLFWKSNEIILLTNSCGELKQINVTTQSVQKIANFGLDFNHGLQKSYFSEQVPNYYFYTAITDNTTQHHLYRLNLSTKEVELVAGNLGVYELIFGNKFLALSPTGNEDFVRINLETLETLEFKLNGSVLAFSPDDKKVLVFLENEQKRSLYDFDCLCLEPITLNGSGTPIWRQEGLFGVEVVITGGYIYNYSYVFRNLLSGEVLISYDQVLNDESIAAPSGTLVASFVAADTYTKDRRASLVTFDLSTKTSKTLATVTNYRGGITNLAISPDQQKIVFSYIKDSFQVRLIAVNN